MCAQIGGPIIPAHLFQQPILFGLIETVPFQLNVLQAKRSPTIRGPNSRPKHKAQSCTPPDLHSPITPQPSLIAPPHGQERCSCVHPAHVLKTPQAHYSSSPTFSSRVQLHAQTLAGQKSTFPESPSTGSGGKRTATSPAAGS